MKSQNPQIKIVAVEPAESSVLSGGAAGPHKIQGIGAGFVPEILNAAICDEIIPISSDDAYAECRALCPEAGNFRGHFVPVPRRWLPAGLHFVPKAPVKSSLLFCRIPASVISLFRTFAERASECNAM